MANELEVIQSTPLVTELEGSGNIPAMNVALLSDRLGLLDKEVKAMKGASKVVTEQASIAVNQAVAAKKALDLNTQTRQVQTEASKKVITAQTAVNIASLEQQLEIDEQAADNLDRIDKTINRLDRNENTVGQTSREIDLWLNNQNPDGSDLNFGQKILRMLTFNDVTATGNATKSRLASILEQKKLAIGAKADLVSTAQKEAQLLNREEFKAAINLENAKNMFGHATSDVALSADFAKNASAKFGLDQKSQAALQVVFNNNKDIFTSQSAALQMAIATEQLNSYARAQSDKKKRLALYRRRATEYKRITGDDNIDVDVVADIFVNNSLADLAATLGESANNLIAFLSSNLTSDMVQATQATTNRLQRQFDGIPLPTAQDKAFTNQINSIIKANSPKFEEARLKDAQTPGLGQAATAKNEQDRILDFANQLDQDKEGILGATSILSGRVTISPVDIDNKSGLKAAVATKLKTFLHKTIMDGSTNSAKTYQTAITETMDNITVAIQKGEISIEEGEAMVDGLSKVYKAQFETHAQVNYSELLGEVEAAELDTSMHMTIDDVQISVDPTDPIDMQRLFKKAIKDQLFSFATARLGIELGGVGPDVDAAVEATNALSRLVNEGGTE